MDIFKLGDKILALLEAVFGFWNNQISLVFDPGFSDLARSLYDQRLSVLFIHPSFQFRKQLSFH